jgi:hypothetical protein
VTAAGVWRQSVRAAGVWRQSVRAAGVWRQSVRAAGSGPLYISLTATLRTLRTASHTLCIARACSSVK